ncbi:MAG: Flp pilus assembly complex ATPase component TadA, partial [Candidatus Diapherotrites archaeon]|nr:Flp pilus assembly complex ATPase component TadA [Candidatus Diapherotrites archaeon]
MGVWVLELVVSDACDSCGKCLAVCRHKLSRIALLKCMHCAPEKAKCLLACRRNAIYEVSGGILAVDMGKCNGCGACTAACAHGAISVVNGKAVKCDLCAPSDFRMPCIPACGKKALRLCKLDSEIDEIEKILGWRVYKIADAEKRGIIAQGANYEIAETREGLIYCIQGIPELTRQEALLLSSVLSEFQEKNEEAEPRALEESLRRYCRRNFLELDSEQHNYLLKVLEMLVFGFGAISELLSNGNLEEIAVIGLGKNKPVYVYERKLGWLRTNFYFCDETTLKNLVNKMSRAIGRRLSMQTPKLNAALPSGERICATISPVSVSGPSLTIRKFRETPFTPKDLLNTQTISASALSFLQFALQTDCSMLICGNTGSGKTSTLNALFNFIPESERIIVTEETPEINLKHRHVVRLNVADG